MASGLPALRELAGLEARMGSDTLLRRLVLESGQDERHYPRMGDFLHPEHLPFAGRVLHYLLTATGLRARGRRNALALQVRRNEVVLERLPASLDRCTLLHLSDLHLDAGERCLRALIDAVSGLAWHACVLTGDYRFATTGSCDAAIHALRRLARALEGPVYAVLGNHDGLALVPAMEALGWRVLLNERSAWQREGAQLHIAGIDDAHYFRTHDLGRALRGLGPDACTVLLSHTAEPYRAAAAAGVDLMLSGHTHGGQICLPGGIPVLTDSPAPRRLARGPWRFRRMTGYTSAGCGCSVIDARFYCPPEVTLHVLRSAGRAC
jgi:predicted MPP superfamily phosphohydrolase